MYLFLKNLMPRHSESDDGGSGDGGGGSAGSTTTETETITDSSAADNSTPTSSPVDWNSLVPDEYKERPSVKAILESEKPGEELLKRFVGLETKLGERVPFAPPADASDEDWQKFTETLRPEKPDDYVLEPVDLGDERKEVAELINNNRSPEYIQGVRELLHKNNVPKRMADGLIRDMVALDAGIIERSLAVEKANQEALNKNFDELAQKTFGGDRTKAIEHGTKFLTEHVTDRAKEIFQQLLTKDTVSSNEVLMLFAETGMSVQRKYDAPDKFIPNNTVPAAPSTLDTIRVERQKLMAEKEYFDKSINPIKTDELRRQVQELQRKELLLQGLNPDAPFDAGKLL